MPSSQMLQNNTSSGTIVDYALPISYCLLTPNQSTSWNILDRSGIRVIIAALIIGYGMVRRFFPYPARQKPSFSRCLMYVCNLQPRPPAVSCQELFILISIGIFIQHCVTVLQMYRFSLQTVLARPRYPVARFRTLDEVQAANLRIKIHRSLQLTPAQQAAVGHGSEIFFELDFTATDSAYLVRCADAHRLALSSANYDAVSRQLRFSVVSQPVLTGIRVVCARELHLFEAGLLDEGSVRVKTGRNQTKLPSYRSELEDYSKLLVYWCVHFSVAVAVFLWECYLGSRASRSVSSPRLIRSKSEPCVSGRVCSWSKVVVRRFSCV